MPQAGTDDQTVAALRSYLELSGSEGKGHSTVPMSDWFRRFLGPSARLRAKQWATLASASQARSKAQRCVGGDPLRLHLGSGGNNLVGWINVDLVGSRADLIWDIRRPLPFPPSTVEAVFLEHVIEHMTLSETMRVLNNVRDVMAEGGRLRIGVPDAGLYARAYAIEDGTLERLRPGRPTAMLALAEVFQGHGHVSAWDGETLRLVLRECLFIEVQVMTAGVSGISPVPDSPSREPETVYVEAVKSVSSGI